MTGRAVSCPIGFAQAEVLDKSGIIPVVFAAGRDAEVLGATALEILGLTVDPVRGEVRQKRSLLAV